MVFYKGFLPYTPPLTYTPSTCQNQPYFPYTPIFKKLLGVYDYLSRGFNDHLPSLLLKIPLYLPMDRFLLAVPSEMPSLLAISLYPKPPSLDNRRSILLPTGNLSSK